MCQLFLTHLGNSNINKLALSIALRIDAVGNVDGTGLMSIDKKGMPVVWKTKLAANNLSNLGYAISASVKTSLPVIAHVRASSRGIVVTDDNAHPFSGERFVLAHNGRLWSNLETPVYTYGDDTNVGSDSKEFLDKLEELAKASPQLPFIDIFRATMDNFKGKYAMMIFDNLTKEYYVCRGSSADLHICYVTNTNPKTGEVHDVGFVINTKKASLKEAIDILEQGAQAITGNLYTFGEVTELEKDTVYKVVENRLEKVGVVKENSVSYSYATASITPFTSSTQVLPVTRPEKAIVRIYEFMSDHSLSFVDIDSIMYILFGFGIAGCTLETLEEFVSRAIPVISAPKADRAKTKVIVGDNGLVHSAVYKKVPELEFPWMLSNKEQLNLMLKELELFHSARS